MIRPKKHLCDIHRTPHSELDRAGFTRLDMNEDTTGLPQEVIEEALSKITPYRVATYPHLNKFYNALSKHLSVGADYLFVTAGSEIAIKTAFEVFIEPGDEVIMSYPSYAMYAVYAKLFQAKIIKIKYDENLILPINKLINSVSEKTKLVVLPNPDSPTGAVLEKGKIIDLLDKAKACGAVVLIDEAYYRFYPHSVVDLVDDYPNLIVTRTFSKAYRLASARLGFAVAHPDTIRLLRSFKPMYESNSFALIFGEAILNNDHLVEEKVKEVNAGKNYLVKEVSKLNLHTYPSHGNFMHINVGEENVAPLKAAMKKSGILVRTGFDHPTLKQCIRLSLGPPQQMEKAVCVLKEYFK